MAFSPNVFLPLTRLIVFGSVILFSFIVLVLAAHLTDLTNRNFSGYFTFAALSIAVSLLTLLSLPVMFFMDRVHRGTIPSYISFELGWIGFLWVMWLAAAGTTASTNGTQGRCSFGFRGADTICGEINAIEAFAFINWLALLIYFTVLLAYSISAHTKGNHAVWTGAVNDTDFESKSSYLPRSNAPTFSQPHHAGV